jgi:hypothetical protein
MEIGMRIVLLIALAVLLVGCGARGSECASREWATFESPPIAAEGPIVSDDPQAAAARLGPFETAAEIDALELGAAPGWGCDVPPSILAGAWGSVEPEPAGDPVVRLELLPVVGERDLGNGFSLRMVVLRSPVRVPAGEVVFVALGLLGDNPCGAIAIGPSEGRFWRWNGRDGAGWREGQGRLVAIAHGRECE